jgi:hypothetical protein
MQDWEREIDIRNSITSNTLTQMVSPEKGSDLYARTAIGLVGRFFREHNTFPVNYLKFWQMAKDEGFDSYEDFTDGPVMDAACRFIETIEEVAIKYGIARLNIQEDTGSEV